MKMETGENRNKIFLGDCLDLMPEIPDKSIDMILCDLPYGTTACKWDTVIPFEPLWKQYKRLIKDNGAIVLTASQPFTSALVMSNPGWFRYEWIWDKRRGCNFQNSHHQPMKSHENICIFYKNKTHYHPQWWFSTPYRQNARPRSNTIEGINGGSAALFCPMTESMDGRRYPLSIISAARDGDRIHPTQKPVALFEYLIRTYTNEGDLVLDNCAGSGTTGVACINTKRNFILMEKDEKHFEIVKKRIAGMVHQFDLCD